MNKFKYLATQTIDPSGGAWIVHLLSVACAAAASFVMPVKGYLIIIGVLVVVDMYTGWRASGKMFTSKGMGGTIDKTVLYMVAILICRGVDIAFNLTGLTETTYLVAALIASRELLSNLENISKVTGIDLVSRVRDIFKLNKP
jgi:phage-related holin